MTAMRIRTSNEAETLEASLERAVNAFSVIFQGFR